MTDQICPLCNKPGHDRSAHVPAAAGTPRSRSTGRDIVVRRYSGDAALQRGLRVMAKKGYVVQTQNSRKALMSASAGVFTRKQIHTVTFRKGSPLASTPPVAASTVRPSTTPSPVGPPLQSASARDDLVSQLERLGALRDSGVLTSDEFEAAKARLLG